MSKGKVSRSHTHNDGTRGPDIYIKDERGETEHKIHVSDPGGTSETSEGGGVLQGIADAAAGVWDILTGGKKDD